MKKVENFSIFLEKSEKNVTFSSVDHQKWGFDPPKTRFGPSKTSKMDDFNDFDRSKWPKVIVLITFVTFFWYLWCKNGPRPAKRGVMPQHPRGGGRHVRSRRRFSNAPPRGARAIRVVVSGPRRGGPRNGGPRGASRFPPKTTLGNTH